MTERGDLTNTKPLFPPSLSTNSSGATSSVIRPRNRRPDNSNPPEPPCRTASSGRSSEGLLHPQTAVSDCTRRSPSLFERPRTISSSENGAPGGDIAQFLGDSWTQSWTSVQSFASTLMSRGSSRPSGVDSPKLQARSRPRSRPDAWGPLPPASSPGINDGAAGSLAEREAALKAAKTASVLESHDRVNGGLDITGRHKRRTSDEITSDNPETEEHLVYVHHVQPSDTFAGIILRYKCREDVFRKSNGLWSRDSIQTRRWLIIPVDSCEIRGRPCNPASWHGSRETDLLAPTPSAAGESTVGSGTPVDYFNQSTDTHISDAKAKQPDEMPWTHVRWVQVESFSKPVEIARVARQTLGYFPPRRKKGTAIESETSTPRQSSEFSSIPPSSIERSLSHTRRLSSLSGRPQISGSPMSSRSRVNSETTDNRPAWMRRPGGVGSMSRSIRAPGPDKDYFNSWATRHIPGLTVDGLPSMSIMGSETARFGFGQGDESGIVESHFEEGRNATPSSRQGTGLDKAAAAVESWLRGALAKRPSTPMLRGRVRPTGMPGDQDITDLIELTDTASEDGRAARDSSFSTMLNSTSLGTTGRNDSSTTLRGRARIGADDKGKKKD